MSERPSEAQNITRRAALERGAAGVAAVGAASALAAALTTPPAAAAVPETRPQGDSSPTPDSVLPTAVAGVRIPDSELARSAAAFAKRVSSETLFHHVMRSYLYGALLFDRGGVRYDRELAFVAAVLHDLGLVPAYQSPDKPFEVDGADAARTFLRERRVPAGRAEVVWDAIALHTNVAVAGRKRPEVGIVSVGSGLDFTGNGLQQLPSDALADILAAFPRAGFKQEALDNILALCRTKPMSVLMHPFAEVGRRHLPDFRVPTVEDLLLAAPFEE
ncbi:HD domain-containing protein [Streptomyces sp. G44]|uniref:HD domain-containing protein n=1 Tax=Streptomyces sp. G44 TaxID=2807632 RepID=UPI0019607B03|nr:HD domain-containing protein [Streptomyces sp. G44]MBM7171459.1 HD domain-containing protein [Streptomyces sp. G44]